ncbi:MAG: hypothetical protein PVF77_13065, partial [Anaerolineae bacterium]
MEARWNCERKIASRCGRERPHLLASAYGLPRRPPPIPVLSPVTILVIVKLETCVPPEYVP